MIALECKEEWSAQVSIPSLLHRVWVGPGLQKQQQAALAARLHRGEEDPTEARQCEYNLKWAFTHLQEAQQLA